MCSSSVPISLILLSTFFMSLSASAVEDLKAGSTTLESIGEEPTVADVMHVQHFVEGAVGVETPTVNISKLLPSLAIRVGSAGPTRILRCSTASDGDPAAILVVGGERPAERTPPPSENIWDERWGDGRVGLVLVGARAGTVVRGSCELGDIIGGAGSLSWVVRVEEGGMPRRTPKVFRSGMATFLHAAEVVDRLEAELGVPAYESLLEMGEDAKMYPDRRRRSSG
jgi:hypothetical protein